MKKNSIVLMAIFTVSAFSCINAATYTMTNLSKKRTKVTYRESFKDEEQIILEPGQVLKKDTYLANCLDYVQVEAVDKNGKVISPFPYKQAPVCALATTVCIVNGGGPNPVEVYQAWSGTSAEDCAKGRDR